MTSDQKAAVAEARAVLARFAVLAAGQILQIGACFVLIAAVALNDWLIAGLAVLLIAVALTVLERGFRIGRA